GASAEGRRGRRERAPGDGFHTVSGRETAPFDVCVVTTIHSAYDARVYQRNTLALVERGYRVCLIAPWPREGVDERISFVSMAMPRNRRSRALHSWRTYRRAAATPARAYHFHDLDFLPFALRLAGRTGRPVVYDCHENYGAEIAHQKDWIPR